MMTILALLFSITAAIAEPFGNTVGLCVKFSQGEPQSALANLSELRVKWVRDAVNWRDVERAPGVYSEFSAALRQRLEFYRANGISVVFGLWYENNTAYPADPLNAEAYGKYAVEIARRLKAIGVKFVLELWNEPHNFSIRPRLGGDWVGHPPSPWVDQYLAMVRSAVEKVKAYDPSVKLLSCDDMWAIHYWFLATGLPQNLDGFAFHPYAQPAPEMAAVDYNTDWATPYGGPASQIVHMVDQDRSFRSACRRLRERARSIMGREPELWITEVGWSLQWAPQETVAKWLPRMFIVAASSGVKATCWFSSRDVVDGPMGLVDNSGVKRLPYAAFRTMTQQLGDYELVSQIVGADSPTKGLQAFLFRKGGEYKVAAWTTGIDSATLPISAVSAVDHLGRPVVVTNPMVIKPAPTYLSGVQIVALLKNFR